MREETPAEKMREERIIEEQTKPPNLNRPVESVSIPAHIIIPVWMIISTGLIIFNKLILTTYDFRFPIFLTTWHLLYATVATRLMHLFKSSLVKGVSDVDMSWKKWSQSVLPIAVCFSGSLIMSNVSYLYLTVSFIQMLKAFNLVCVMLIGALFGLDKLTPRSIGWGVVVSAGVALASLGEINFNLTGVLSQTVAVLFESFRLILVQKLLSTLKMSPIVSLYFFAPVSSVDTRTSHLAKVCFLLNTIPLILYEEQNPFVELHKVGLFSLFLNGTLSFCLNVSAVFLVSATSGLTLTLAGVCKDVLLVLGSSTFFGNVVTTTQYLGYSIAVAGIFILKSEDTVRQWTNYVKEKIGYRRIPPAALDESEP
ncbi:hypothetical protein PROFUN_05015 [Planoprotostelium fungivorum]|uniref:Sugar phosphate transporter domain-containing protein n=1 Tax=Planoprotostelium fungivorum TaxID=1890364 RepID=A0A2P6NSF3_9EUKA|nr:hypothetical protein PROFUN_05015 [Planoprotostelium fungivorum]